MVRRAGLSCLAVAAMAAGCGGGSGESQLQQAFPDASNADAALLQRDGQRLSRVYADDLAAVSAIKREDAARLDLAAGRLGDDGRSLMSAGERLDSRRLGDLFAGYGRRVARLGEDYGRIAGAARARDGAAVDRVLKYLIADKKAVQRMDRRFVGAVRPVLGTDAKQTLDERLRRMDRRYHEAAGG
jgi:hypothetical protein